MYLIQAGDLPFTVILRVICSAIGRISSSVICRDDNMVYREKHCWQVVWRDKSWGDSLGGEAIKDSLIALGRCTRRED